MGMMGTHTDDDMITGIDKLIGMQVARPRRCDGKWLIGDKGFHRRGHVLQLTGNGSNRIAAGAQKEYAASIEAIPLKMGRRANTTHPRRRLSASSSGPEMARYRGSCDRPALVSPSALPTSRTGPTTPSYAFTISWCMRSSPLARDPKPFRSVVGTSS